MLSKQKTKSKLDKITKKKKRTGHVPMTTAVNDASKTIDESRIDLDQTYDESQKKGNRIKVVESDDSDSQSKKKVKNKIIAKKSSSNSNKTSMSPFVDTSLDKKM